MNLNGVGVAMVTPFNENKSIDFISLEKIVSHVIDGGVNYIVALGTTAETATLSSSEKLDVLKHIIRFANNRVPVIVGIGGNNTTEVLKDLEKYIVEGVSGILSVSPYYNKPNQEGIYQHYTTIAKATSLPIILYNVPGRTGSNVLPSTIKRLYTEFKNIIAVKEASGNIVQNMEIVGSALDTKFTVLSGDDNLVLPQIACGMKGVISVAANCFTKEFCELTHTALKNDYETARKLHYKLLRGIDLLFAEGNPAGVKCVLSEMGLCKNEFRLPIVPVSENLHSQIKEYLKTFNA